MTNSHHIACLTAHQISGSVSVIECKIFLKQASVNAVSHIVEHILRARFKKPLRNEPQHSTDNLTSYHQSNGCRKNAESVLDTFSVPYNVIHYDTHDLGIDHI